MPEVFTPFAFCRADGLGALFRFVLYFHGEFVRQVVFANNDLGGHAEIAWPPEYFDHATRSRRAATRKPQQLDVHHRAIQIGNAADTLPADGQSLRATGT